MFSIGAQDLAAGLSQILLGLAVIGFIASIVVVRARRRGSTTVALDVTAALSSGWIALSVIGIGFAVYSILLAPVVLVDAPATTAWPDTGGCDALSPGSVDGPTLVCGSVNGARLEVAGLPAGIRALLFIAQTLLLALATVPAVALRAIAVRAAAGTPFDRRVAQTLWASAMIVLVAGLAQDLTGSIARTLTAQAVLPEEGALSAPSAFELTVPVWPFAAAVALAALAAVFRHGARLQRETEGLV